MIMMMVAMMIHDGDGDRRDEEAKVCHLILTSLSEEARIHLRSVPAFKKAVDDSDSYAMYYRSSSFAVAQSIFQQLLSVKMDGTFSKLVHDLTDHRRQMPCVPTTSVLTRKKVGKTRS